jgi:hypothetical protein
LIAKPEDFIRSAGSLPADFPQSARKNSRENYRMHQTSAGKRRAAGDYRKLDQGIGHWL